MCKSGDMQDVISIDLSDKRLESRYFELVKAHMQHNSATATAAGPAIPSDLASSFSATQATWRFFANEKVTPTANVRRFAVRPLRTAENFRFLEGRDNQKILLISGFTILMWEMVALR